VKLRVKIFFNSDFENLPSHFFASLRLLIFIRQKDFVRFDERCLSDSIVAVASRLF